MVSRILDCLCRGVSNSGSGPEARVRQQRYEQTFLPPLSLLHCSLGQFIAPPPPTPLQIHRVIPLTQIIDFAFLKICYVGAWKCQARHPVSEIYWEFIDHQKLLSKEEGEGKSVQRAHQNATTVSHFTPEQELISGKFAYTCICTDPIKRQGADTIPGFKAENLPVFQL